MKNKLVQSLQWRALSAMLLAFALFSGQTFAQQATVAAPAQAPALSSAESELTNKISLATIKEITAALSAPEMQGRGTMQPGGDKAAAYIAERFQKMGLKPLGDKNSFFQKIDFTETILTPETAFKIGDEALNIGTDYGFSPYLNFLDKYSDKNVSGEMVFVAYGIQNKRINRKDLAGIDVRGKVVVMLEGIPENLTKGIDDKEMKDIAEISMKLAIWANLFGNGAAALVLVPNGRNEPYPPEILIDYFSRRQISLGQKDNSQRGAVLPLVVVSTKAAEKLFAKSGTNYKDALAQAETNSFKPIKLNQTAKIVAKYKSTQGVSSNVVGVLEGSDPVLRNEAIVFSAHYDAYGMENGKIYPGAADNALGVSEMLAVAEAFTKSAQKPKRSLVFLAVTGEEYGLYGSKYWAKNPTWDIKKVAANLNLDGLGTEVYGPVKTFVGFGAEHSTMGAILNDVSAAFGVKVIPDPMPEEKIFLRSDHYSFVERGVPALMLHGAPAGDPQVWIKRMKDWEKTDYHNVGDVVRPDWHWEGAKTVADVMGIMGHRIANGEKMPEWLPASRFGKLERGNTKEIKEEN